MKNIVKHLKSGEYQSPYLFCGEEGYLKRFYENRFRERILPDGMELMNVDVYEGKAVLSDNINDAVQTLPFLSEHRLVIVKNSGLFATGRKDETQKCTQIIKDIPETTILVFVEEHVDKRNSLYKKVNEAGYVVEFKTPKESELVDWAAKLLHNGGVEISRATASYLIKTVSYEMDAIALEAEKLIGYKGGGEVSREDIDQVCTKSLEARIFDLVDALGNRNPAKALDIYNNLMTLRESPIMVLSMVARQFRLILQCKELKDTAGIDEICARLGIRSFVAKECIRQGGNFAREQLLKAVYDCLHTDIGIKSGQIGDRIGVEMLIVKYAS